jgi:type II secretory pathway component PulC
VLTEARLKRLAILTSTVFLLAAAWIVLEAFEATDITPPPPPSAAVADTPPKPKAAAPAELTRLILANDVFGLKPVPGQQDKPKEPPKPAEIDMELAGTVISSDGRHSTAFLRDKANKAQKAYAVGASVKDARIKSIGKNFVILERQGREEILSMKP